MGVFTDDPKETLDICPQWGITGSTFSFLRYLWTAFHNSCNCFVVSPTVRANPYLSSLTHSYVYIYPNAILTFTCTPRQACHWVKVKYDQSSTKMNGNAADTCVLDSLPVSIELHATGTAKEWCGGATCGLSTASSNLWTQECQKPLGCSLQADQLHGGYSDALLLKTPAQPYG